MLRELLDDDQGHLLDLLGRSLAAIGPPHAAPFIEPTRAFFPEPYEPTVVGAGQLLHRLLSWAGLGGYELVIEDARAPLDELLAEQLAVTQPAVSFVAVENRQVMFQIEQLGPGDLTAAALCHEVARAALAVNQLEDDDELAAAASIGLGFGLITLPAAVAYRSSTVLAGHHTVTRQAIVLTGALPPGDLAFLLAAWLTLRQANPKELLARHFAESQSKNVLEWIAALTPHRPAIMERMKLTYSDERPAARVPEVKPLAGAPLERLRRADELHRKPFAGGTTRRYSVGNGLSYGMMGGLVGLFAMIPLAMSDHLSLMWLPPSVLLVGGVVLGRRRRTWYCQACGMLLHAHENLCPKCGARIEGEVAQITSPAEMADADDDDELTKAALAAAPPDEDER